MPEHRMGRPTKYDLDLVAIAASLMRHEGLPVRAAAAAVGCGRTTIWRWSRQYQEAARIYAAGKAGRRGWVDARRCGNYRNRSRTGRAMPQPLRVYRESMAAQVLPSIRRTAAALGVSRASVLRWSHKVPAFAMAMAMARFEASEVGAAVRALEAAS